MNPDDNHENLPFVSINDAISWVCIDCGTKNFNEMRVVETAQEREKFEAIFGPECPDEFHEIPSTVTCIKCSKEWSTCDHKHGGPMETLMELAEVLTLLSDEEYQEEAMENLLANSEDYSNVANWALEVLTDEDPEPIEDDDDLEE